MKKYFLLLMLFSLHVWGQRELQQEKLLGDIKTLETKTFTVVEGVPAKVYNYNILNKFDTKGKLYEVLFLGNDELMDNKEVIAYLPTEFVKEVAIYNREGRKDKVMTFQYNLKNQLIKEIKSVTNKGVEYESTFEYNDQKQLIKKIQFFPSIDYTVTEDYSYFNDNISELRRASHTGINTEKYLYNENGWLLEKTELNDKNIVFSDIFYEYNEKGLKTALIKIDETGEISYFEQYEYQFDSKGNWIEKKIYIKGDWTSVEKRNITYF